MSFLVFLSATPMILFFLGSWSSLPLMFNIWLSSLSGLLVIFLFRNSESAAGVSVFVVEESMSLGIIFTWFFLGGSLFILFFLMIKSAVPPFHNWLIKVLSSCKSETFGWAITGHKTPVMMFLLSFKALVVLSALVFSVVVGVFCLMSLGETRSMVILSSGNVLASTIIFIWLWGSESLIFFLCYCLIIWGSLTKKVESFDSMFFLIGLMGLPPLLLFQMKWMVLLSLFKSSWVWAFLFVLASAFSVVIYIRFCFFTDSKYKNANIFLGVWALLSGGVLLV